MLKSINIESKMIEVIQVFKSVKRYQKDNYETDKLTNPWEESLVSKNGYLKDQSLYLPDVAGQEPDIEKAKTIVILDIKDFDPFAPASSREDIRPPRWHIDTNKKHMLYARDQVICYYKQAATMDFDLFRIEKKQPGNFNLFLKYSNNRYDIGAPEREDHKIAILNQGMTLRYRINGKSDRKERIFTECDFMIEYLGQADKVVFKELNKIKVSKTANKEYKLVDERKILK